MDVQIEILNLKDVQRAIIKGPEIMRDALNTGLEKSAFLVERESKIKTPVDTGRLRASIFTTLRPLVATVMPKTNYAVFVHEGTTRMRARPYMTEGLEAAMSEIKRVMNDEINKGLVKINLKGT